MQKRTGLVQVYTGDGKGKTTAAVGCAVRALACGLRVGCVYFCKNPGKWEYGESIILKKNGADIFYFAKRHPRFCKDVTKADVRKECVKALAFIKNIFKKNKYDLLVLDEICVCAREGVLTVKEVLGIVNSKPRNLELILTGRGAPKKIMEKADYVSRITKLKHPYDKGIKGRKGIEY
ncbi:MAG: cob(I)yrinic acid a,c-diamide adenosyltransferase [Candidatus Omnitrophica bacterium]|nr:cob(I)yrinic acid a,c-diamide adenosyltransferase [Candidatus Omnitrophota bacterium]MBU2063298.1 cob(I)yrinic acid a,c-diamide adenosyltransferase [Candidatus Omnitrophota bacterium]